MIAADVRLGQDVSVPRPELVNLYGCVIGDKTRIGPFVEIQSGVEVGSRCKISSHSFLCEGVTVEDGVFIGHGVMFVNDADPAAVNEDGSVKGDDDWTLQRTVVRSRASIGSNATILGGLTIGEGALVGAGAVVTKDVPANSVVVGVPARVQGPREDLGRQDV